MSHFSSAHHTQTPSDARSVVSSITSAPVLSLPSHEQLAACPGSGIEVSFSDCYNDPTTQPLVLDSCGNTESLGYAVPQNITYGLMRTRILDLPNEILHEIFTFTLARPDGWMVTMGMLPHAHDGEGIWWLGRVCGRWRRLLQSTPAFWTHLYLDLSGDLMRRSGSKSQLETFIGLSRNSPLTLWLRMPRIDDFPSGNPEELDEPSWVERTIDRSMSFIEPLINASHRWRDVQIDVTYHCQLQRFDSVQGKLPQLTQLWLYAHACNGHAAIVSAFQDAPKLTIVMLSGIKHGKIRIPWLQIRTLRTIAIHAGRTTKDDLDALRYTSNVAIYEHRSISRDIARIHQTPNAPGPILNLTPVRLDRVHHLRLESYSTEHTDHLVLPCLQTAKFRLQDTRFPKWPSIISLFQRSQCALSTLCIRGDFAFDTIQFVQMLSAVPSLQTLKIMTQPPSTALELLRTKQDIQNFIFREECLLNSLIRRLIHTQQERCPLPNLRSLYLNVRSAGYNLNWDLVRHMLGSRLRGVAASTEVPFGVERLEKFQVADAELVLRHQDLPSGWQDMHSILEVRDLPAPCDLLLVP